MGFIVVCVVWGTTMFSVKAGLEAGWAPLWFCAVRLVLASVLLALLLLTPVGGRPLGRAGWIAVLPLGIFGIAANFGLMFWGEQYVGAGLASLLVGTQPLTTTLMACALVRRPIGLRFGAGLGLGLVALLVLFGGAQAMEPNAILGAGAILAGATIYGAIFVYIGRRVVGFNLVRVAAAQNTIGAAILVPIALIVEGPPRIPTEPVAFAALAYLVLASSIIALILSTWLVGRMGASRFSLTSYITPVIGLIAGVGWLHEPIEATMVIGSGLILIALVLTLGTRTDRGPVAGARSA